MILERFKGDEKPRSSHSSEIDTFFYDFSRLLLRKEASFFLISNLKPIRSIQPVGEIFGFIFISNGGPTVCDHP